jgi:hypothetical protein
MNILAACRMNFEGDHSQLPETTEETVYFPSDFHEIKTKLCQVSRSLNWMLNQNSPGATRRWWRSKSRIEITKLLGKSTKSRHKICTSCRVLIALIMIGHLLLDYHRIQRFRIKESCRCSAAHSSLDQQTMKSLVILVSTSEGNSVEFVKNPTSPGRFDVHRSCCSTTVPSIFAWTENQATWCQANFRALYWRKKTRL